MNRVLLLTILTVFFSHISMPVWANWGEDEGDWPRWYVGIRGSVNNLKSSGLGTSSVNNADNRDPGFGIGASVGAQLPENLGYPLNNVSVELEYARFWHHIDNNRTDFFTPFLIQSVNEQGYDIDAFMLNAYYQFPTQILFAPYVGGGLGFANAELEPPRGATSGDYEDFVGAWQLMAGLSFETHPESLTHWRVGYRYFQTTTPEFNNGVGGRVSIDTLVHSLEAGMRFRV